MRVFLVYFFILTSFFSFSQKNPKTIGFIENKGQIVDQKGKENKAVLYLLNTPGLNVQLRNNGFSYDIYETKKIPLTKKDKRFRETDASFREEKETPDYSLEYNYHRIDIDFINSNATVKLVAEEKSSDYDNYYNVAHVPEGITNVHKYKKVTYQNIYNNIDAVFFIPKDTTKAVEYNFIVKPGGKVSDIQLKFNGAKTELADNKIKMNVRFGQMEETLPLSWIENGNSRKEIAVGYKKIKKNVYGFEGDVNVSNKIVVIDPVPIRLWGTYYGGDWSDYIIKIKNDSNGNIIIGGDTTSTTNIATTGAYQANITPWNSPHILNQDCFFAKFTNDGIRLWGTYIGGNEIDNFYDLAIDNLNNIAITGRTNSNTSTFTTPFSHQPTLNFNFIGSANNLDAFLVKFNENGQRIWGTFYGGSFNDVSRSVAIDNDNNLIISGITYSESNIATPNAHKTVFNNSWNTQYDGFIAKFSPNGNRIWGTYFGGDMQEDILDSDSDSFNNLYFVGKCWSTNGISTPGCFQSTKTNDWDGFLIKFSPNGNLLWGTYYGGESYDQLSTIVISSNDNIFIGGKTGSNQNIATANSFLSTAPHLSNQGYDGYFAKFNGMGNRLWSSYFYDALVDIDLDSNENIYFVGSTVIDNHIATPNAYQTTDSFTEGYIQKFNTTGNRIWGTYYGGASHDDLTCITLSTVNNIFFVGGFTSSSNGISTINSHQESYSTKFEDGFFVKLQDCLSPPIVNAQNICAGQNLQLNATGGTNYTWTGPNGFTSNQQNPIITNANVSHSGQYTCTITGTGGCDGPASVTVTVGDTTAPVPNLTNLPTINGDCNTVISTIPTATDNCAGNITATTTSLLNYSTPGTHTIIWNYSDGNGNNNSQNQTVVISATALPTVSTSQLFCIQQNTTINDITITGQNIKWYDAPTGGNLLASTTPLQNGVTYYASQTINGCESTRVPVTVTVQNTPAPTGNATQSFCSSQNATLNNIVVSGSNLIWYDSAAGTTVLPSTTLLTNNTTYYATQTVNGCESPSRFAVTVTLINTLNANDYSKTLCDDLNNGSETVNLSDYNSDLIATTIGNTFTYYHSQNGAENQISSEAITNFSNYNLSVGNNVIFVRIDSNNGCHQVVELNLTLVRKPIIPITDIMPICEGSSITVSAGAGFDSYLWSTTETTPSITITNPGNYSVTVTENHGTITCSSVKNFTVVNSNTAMIAEIITSDWTNHQNTITVLVTGSSVGDYVYSLDGIHYQSSNTFTGLESGEYIVYVKDKNGCGVKSEDFYLLMYPKFFTPNGDSYNDYWKIALSEKEPDMKIRIFDRYGKLLKELGANSQGWDGTYSGNTLPATDYWFVVTRQNGKEYRGHFSLKR